MDARRTVDAPGVAVNRGDLLGQPRIGQGPIRWRPVPPSMKARAINSKDPAHRSNGEVGLLALDKRVHLAYRPSVSLAKKAAAFFRISRSIPERSVLPA